MSSLADIISSTAAGVQKEAKLVKGKKWVKRGAVKKVQEEKEYAERQQRRDEAERAKRRRREMANSAALEQQKKKTRKQLEQTEARLGSSRKAPTSPAAGGGGAAGSKAAPPPGETATEASSSTTKTSSSSSSTTTSSSTSSAADLASSPTASSSLSKPKSPGQDVADGGSKLVLPLFEVVRRLRALGAPITLFGETDLERLQRMRRVEVEGLDDEDILLTGSHAMRNVFLKGKQHREGNDDEIDDLAEFDDDADAAGADADQQDQQGAAGVLMTDAEAQLHNDDKKRKKKKGDHEVSTETFVLRFFRRMLKEWTNDLAARPEHVKNSPEGRIATKTQKQCKDYMRPFLKMCRAKTIEKSILKHAKNIVDACLERNYVFANEEYMRLAIGNAPWPIGVTSVGIHARRARENISTSKIAHVLNDERQRKYVTSMKRLLTYCQTKYPTDPSKMVTQ